MSGLADRLRRAAASVGQALGSRRPGVELVRLDRPELLAPPAPLPLPALPAPPWPPCPRCKQRHEQRPLPRHGGTGLAAAYSRNLLPDPTRPQPLSQGEVDDTSLQRDRFHPWSGR
jgi:hypothetical protein